MSSIFTKHKTIADRSASDRSRHRKKIEKAIKDGIHNIVSEESIIGENGKKKFRIPVKGIKEYRFVYGDNGSRTGSGEGKDFQRGQVIGKKKEEKGKGKSESGKPGNDPGEEYYEVELTLEQVAEYLFKDLNLPNFEKKKNAEVISKKIKRKGYRTSGIRPRLDKKKTAIERIKRMKKQELHGDNQSQDEDFPFRDDDLRYRYFKISEKRTSSAVIFFLMDISGSMGTNKKFLSRSFFFLLYHFIRSKYDKVEICFIAYESQAYEVDEKSFFERGTSGGTIASTAIKLANEVIDSRYHPSSWNAYVFHSSDGDNWTSDNEEVKSQTRDILSKIQFYGYCEIEPKNERSFLPKDAGLSSVFNSMKSDKLKTANITEKEDIWVAFKTFFKGEI
jgi:sporulation protein YhbH